MSSFELEAAIKQTILEYVVDLRNNVFTDPSEQGELMMVECFFENLSAKHITNHIVDQVLPFKDQIRSKKTSFFVKNRDIIFSALPKDRVEHFSNMLTLSEEDGGITEENKDVNWSYMNTLVDLAEEYKKNK